ncbi:MAG TPA: helix-turn-helix domain-containing protein [Candidatus Paceibacterota bacterium]|nr:helix-turn-helix domain-containing protein [Candidatus Paceibacterota bacterium]
MEGERNFSSVLIQAIKAKGLTVEKLALLTGVSDRFLDSFIEEKFNNLPPQPYVRGYVIKIAEVLGLDGEALWSDYLKDNGAIRKAGRDDELPRNRFDLPRFNAKLIILAVLVIAVVAVILLRLPFFSSSGALELLNPAESSVVVGDKDFLLEGKIDSAYTLFLNGERIYAGEDGIFRKQIELQEGFNTFIFNFKKALGKEQTVTRQVFYVPNKGSQNGKNQ